MADQPPAGTPMPVDFSTHVLSLASTALIALGRMPAPEMPPQTPRPAVKTAIAMTTQR